MTASFLKPNVSQAIKSQTQTHTTLFFTVFKLESLNVRGRGFILVFSHSCIARVTLTPQLTESETAEFV